MGKLVIYSLYGRIVPKQASTPDPLLTIARMSAPSQSWL